MTTVVVVLEPRFCHSVETLAVSELSSVVGQLGSTAVRARETGFDWRVPTSPLG